ncbi:amino acid adenylation domain-containing protein [Actinopolyspora saharensis]|uniref:amino acid adenylation domain-containing protein n=1 Tax=Actinopolyspora saharensis TaxID=995062 RepID=UPI003F66A119
MTVQGQIEPARWAWLVGEELSADQLRRVLPCPLGVVDVGGEGEGPESAAAEALGVLAVSEAQLLAGEGAGVRVCLARLGAGRSALLVTGAQPVGRSTAASYVHDVLTAYAEGTGPVHWPGGPAADAAEAGPTPLFELPTDRPRPATRGHRAGSVVRDYGTGPLAEWCEAQNVPLSCGLTSGLAVLLARYAGTEEVPVLFEAGTDPAREVLLPVPDAASPASLAGATARILAEASRHAPTQELPVRLTIDEPSGAAGEQWPASTAVTALPLRTGWTDRDLSLTLTPRAGGSVRVRLDYDAEVFTAHYAEQFLDRLGCVWSTLPDGATLGAVSVLTSADKENVLRLWQGPVGPYPDRCVHELVEGQARHVPEKTAVVCGGTSLTYTELNARANRVAHRLRMSGVVPGRVVGVFAERSTASVVALLAVLKAGGMYLPIDPAQPVERIRYMLRDSGASILVGGPPDEDLPTLELRPERIDQRGPDVTGRPETDPEPWAELRHSACLMYTSGSTGEPKGVEVTHLALAQSTLARGIGGPPPGVDLIVPQLSFDGSAGGLYWTLTTGGTVLLPTDEEVRDPQALGGALEQWPITHLHSVPSHYALMTEAVPERLGELRFVALGGEPLPPPLVSRHFAERPSARLFNDYGPTETTVWATTHECVRGDGHARFVPVGQPLPNYRVHLLDDALRPVPPGLPGEVYIGGDTVAVGYIHQPRLTARQFVPDPFAVGAGGARLYRTNDRARQRPDGELELLGRTDRQVKVRGYRVELGEIEATLLHHPAVADVAVVLRQDGLDRADQTPLTAFVTLADDSEADPSERLEKWMAGQLPEYMCPRVTIHSSLPRTANGKVDTAALLGGGPPAEEPPAQPSVAPEDLSAAQLDDLLRRLNAAR